MHVYTHQECRRLVFQSCKLTATVVALFIAIIACFLLWKQETKYNQLLETMETQHAEELASAIESTKNRYLAVLEAKTDEYDTQTQEQAVEIQSLTEQLNQRRADGVEMFELARKYWYVYKDAPDNHGLSIDDIVYLDDLCKEDDLNPHIMFCIYDLESGYTARIDNYGGSSARGLGQVIASTGKSMYENVLNLGYYDHSYAYNPQVNMLITEKMIARNIDSGLYNAIALYSGDQTGWYYNRVLQTAAEHGVDISDTSYQ